MTLPRSRNSLRKQAIRMVRSMILAEKNNVKRAQRYYEQLMAFCQDHHLDFNNTLLGARRYLKENDVALHMNGYL